MLYLHKVRTCTILFITVVALAGCNDYVDEPIGNTPDLSNAIALFYGSPADVELSFPVSKFYSKTELDDPETERARVSESIVALSISGSLAEAGLHLDDEGDFVRAPWKQSLSNIDLLLADPPDEIMDLRPYIVDQMVVQSMYHFTDLLDSSSQSMERDLLINEYLQILVKNRYPNPQIYSDMLDIVRGDLSAAEIASIAKASLDAFERFKELMSPLEDICSECYSKSIEGHSPAVKYERDETLSKLAEYSKLK